MSQTKYQVTLAVDGKHAVSVQSDDPAAVTEGLVWAQATYKKLVTLRRMGPTRGVELGEASEVQPEEAPLCATHQVAMVWQKGRKGFFWSCHEKNADGSWCSFKPPGR